MSEEKPVLIKKFETEEKKPSFWKTLLLVFLMVGLGVISGWFLSSKKEKNSESQSSVVKEQSETIKKGTIVGSKDEKAFKDFTEGRLEKGGIDGEGSHHLVRPGGESQNVYLTSSVIDLDKYVGHEVRVWGETFSAQKAGWLMDVGRLEILD